MKRSNLRLRRQKNKKNNKSIILICLLIIFAILFFSVIFSLLNIGNNKIIKNVKIDTIDLSNLTQEEAKEKLENWQKTILMKDVKVSYKDIEEIISIEQMKMKFDIDKVVKESFLIGKSGNIIKDNYDILRTLIFSKKIECDIELDQNKIDEKINEINSKLQNSMVESSYYIEGEKLIIKKGKDGVEVDKNAFKKELERTILEPQERKFEISTIDVKPKEINIEKIHEEIFKEMKNASIKEEPIEVIPEVIGIDFSISLEEAKNILRENKEEYIIPLKITMPEVTLETLGTKAFPEKLAEYSTTYNALNENRETNLMLASEKINGTIILPGETFSYNKIVGERTIAKGYKEAAVYSGGKVIDGIGGGICQLSSTLYNAALYANLQITQRSSHRFLTSYVTAGRDATVSWGTIDFCFKNTRKYPIKIISEVKNGVVTASIYGIKQEKEYKIIIKNEVIETLPYTTNYVNDSNLEQGEEIIKQYGANGAKSVTYKIIEEDGVIISKDIISNDVYSPLERIIIKGNKKVQGASAKPIEDETIKMNEIKSELLDAIKELE